MAVHYGHSLNGASGAGVRAVTNTNVGSIPITMFNVSLADGKRSLADSNLTYVDGASGAGVRAVKHQRWQHTDHDVLADSNLEWTWSHLKST
jgi:hypothetical protein